MILKNIAEFHIEKHADPVVSQWKWVIGDIGFLIYIVKRNTKRDVIGPFNSEVE